MTVLCGGLSGGELWDSILIRDVRGVEFVAFVPMFPKMTAEDLGGVPAGVFCGECPGDYQMACEHAGQCLARHGLPIEAPLIC